MPVHTLHVFDRKGKTLFTKSYAKKPLSNNENTQEDDAEAEEEQRKLVFGMLFSLREVVQSLSPTNVSNKIHSIQTGASTLYHVETLSGLRFALYVTPSPSDGSSGSNTSIQKSLDYVYNDLWIPYVVRSPLYDPTNPTASIPLTNFEQKLTQYLQSQSWY